MLIEIEEAANFITAVQTYKPIIIFFEESASIEGYTNFFFPHQGTLLWHPTNNPATLHPQLAGIKLVKGTSPDIDEEDAAAADDTSE